MSRRFAWLVAAALTLALPAVALAKGPESVAKLAAQLSPAVVNIATTQHIAAGEQYPTAPEGSPLNQLFDDANPNQGKGPQAEEEARSLGSGFIIKADGTIVTNNHVIAGADEIVVMLSDGTRLPAKVVGADDKADLAVLKVDASHALPFVEFGDSDTAQVGDWVMAIGNPFGLGGSVTLGIVSARNRDIQEGPYDDFIQTDAAINQGNSGGPLFDMDGRVVGINTAIIARGGASLGIGFAVPVNLARPVVEQLDEYGETRRGWLGVNIQEVTPDIADSLGRPNSNGALVVSVTKTGPADGIIDEGDLILEFNGKPIEKMRDLSRFVAESAVGSKASVKLLRAGKEMSLDITLGRLEAADAIEASAKEPKVAAPDGDPDEPVGPPPGLKDMVGLDLAPIDAELRKTYALEADAKGLVITDVVTGSGAEDAGLVKGLVVSEVNEQKIETVADVIDKVNAAKEAGRPAVLFKVTDATGGSRFIAVRLTK